MSRAKVKKASNGKFNRHKWRFPVTRSTASLETAVLEVQVLTRIKAGRTTESIAMELGLTKGQVSYIAKKGGCIGERAQFRSGRSWVAKRALEYCSKEIINEVARKVTPKFL